MDRKHLKALLSDATLGIAEKCAIGAAAAAVIAVGGVATEANAAIPAPSTQVSSAPIKIAVSPAQAGAILLNLVGLDSKTGELVADHYSHASHASHHSHYSG